MSRRKRSAAAGLRTLTIDAYDSAIVMRALVIAGAFYRGDAAALPDVSKWRPSERAMAAAEMRELLTRLNALSTLQAPSGDTKDAGGSDEPGGDR